MREIGRLLRQTLRRLRLPSFAVLSLIVAATAAPATTAAPAQRSDAVLEAQCRQYFRDGCSEAMGRWVGALSFGGLGEWRERAKRIYRQDGFVYGRERAPRLPTISGGGAPLDGTFFVYGDAGPPEGRAVYDPLHHIALYEDGCCAWKKAVERADAAPPPKRVLSRDLRGVATVRGMRLGQSEADVTNVYGRWKDAPVAGHRGVRVLAYTTFPPEGSAEALRTNCGQNESFFFRANRLIEIEFENMC